MKIIKECTLTGDNSSGSFTEDGLPVSHVGLFTTYRLLTDNFGAACSISYNVLEEIEISRKLGEVQDTPQVE